MPRIEQLDDGSFLAVMEAGDAKEEQIAQAIEAIALFAADMRAEPHDQEARKASRQGYWRYSRLEKNLQAIAREADSALRHIKLLDFPEQITPAGEA